MKILVIEDHEKIRKNIVEYLSIQGLVAEGASDGQQALCILNDSHDVVILDVNIPELSGRDFLQKIRQAWWHVPVIIVTSNSLLDDKIDLLLLGADDYLTKPFDMRELYARVLVLGRRKNRKIQTEIPFGDYVLFLEKRILHENGKQIFLTAKEYSILEYLAINKGFPKTKTDILEAVWGIRESELGINSVALEVHISSLRKKLKKSVIETVKGVGYILH